MMRVTQEGITQNTIQRLMQRLSRVEDAQARLSSGKSITKASDDPSAMNQLLVLRAQQRAREQEARNAADGLTWLNMSDSALQAVVSRIHRARELVVRAPQLDGPAREAARSEIAAIQDELRGILNTRVDGRPVFGGMSEGDPIQGAPGTWALNAATGADADITRRVAEQETVTVNVTAEAVVGAVDPLDPEANLFTLLDDVMARITAGDAAGISAALDPIDAALRRVGAQQAKVGANANRIESAMTRNSDDLLAIRGQLAQAEDVDLVEAVMELQTQEVAYQATLAALSRVLQPSLVDFIR